ncbi:MAG: type III-A CRISPR-associated protein Cas10/Csm1 [Anaeromassilibacillus sp.]
MQAAAFYYPSGIPGVSLYQKARLEVCLACCMREAGRESPFLLVSCGLPGIQKFLYTISGKGVLKSLRSRSFYLDLLEEHLMTELLDRLHLCRAHRLYVGGGSSYAVLPNTDRTRETLEACLCSVNQWLLKRFSGALQFLYAWEPCSGPQLKNEGGTAYQEIFARLENKLNQKRNRRFDASGLTWLNSQKMSDPERECRVCAGSSLPLDGDDLCPVCREFRDSSSGLAATGKVAAVCRAVWEEGGTPRTLPSLDGQDWFVYMMDRAQTDRLRAEQPGTVVRVYAPGSGGNADIPLPLGAYAYTIDEKMATFEGLAACSQGIRRLGVLRADVDNLGRAFVSGFHRRLQSGNRCSDSLTASPLAAVDAVFQGPLANDFAGDGGPVEPFHLVWNEAGKRSPRRHVVYAGGDDLFIVAPGMKLWNCRWTCTARSGAYRGPLDLFRRDWPAFPRTIRSMRWRSDLRGRSQGIDAGKTASPCLAWSCCRTPVGRCGMWRGTCTDGIPLSKRLSRKSSICWSAILKWTGRNRTAGEFVPLPPEELCEQLDRTPGQTINVARFAYLLARMEPKG